MLFQSDYWVAASASERTETLRDFLDTDEGIQNLVIIEKNPESDLVKLVEQIVAEGYLRCNLTLVLGQDTGETQVYEAAVDEVGNITHMKTIHVCSTLDEHAIGLLRQFTPILALFV